MGAFMAFSPACGSEIVFSSFVFVFSCGHWLVAVVPVFSVIVFFLSFLN